MKLTQEDLSDAALAVQAMEELKDNTSVLVKHSEVELTSSLRVVIEWDGKINAHVLTEAEK